MQKEYKMATRLYKSRDRRILGVCGGIADFFGIDSTIIRLVMVLITVFSAGTGILAYIIAAINMPERPFQDDDVAFTENMRSANESDKTDEEFDSYFEKQPKKSE